MEYNMEQTEKKIIISNMDLKKAKYSIDILEANIERLNIRNLLNTQLLTADFCIKYILSGDYASCQEEMYISLDDILKKQPHLHEEDFGIV